MRNVCLLRNKRIIKNKQIQKKHSVSPSQRNTELYHAIYITNTAANRQTAADPATVNLFKTTPLWAGAGASVGVEEIEEGDEDGSAAGGVVVVSDWGGAEPGGLTVFDGDNDFLGEWEGDGVGDCAVAEAKSSAIAKIKEKRKEAIMQKRVWGRSETVEYWRGVTGRVNVTDIYRAEKVRSHLIYAVGLLYVHRSRQKSRVGDWFRFLQ